MLGYLGQGAYGVVAAAQYEEKSVAIKKCKHVFQSKVGFVFQNYYIFIFYICYYRPLPKGL